LLFNSYGYILVYLPVVAAIYYALLRIGLRGAVVWLALASFYFYADWAVRYLPLFLASALFNFAIGRQIETRKHLGAPLLFIGVAVDLGLLVVFKYTNFLVDQVLPGIGLHLPSPEIVLPIGISFFTFTQIAYLVDLRRGICGRYDLWRYLLFVSFFPHLLAGPILHHREMMPQFARRLPGATYVRHIAFGLVIFSLGLFKKVWLADSIAPYANAAFATADAGHPLSAAAAWWGALAYTFQLYFDFSGYSDMAVGSARLVGIRLPYNFDAPYRATSIIEFWRRWHMTLSRFLRDYLYIPLGGSRRGVSRRYLNLFITMVLGGLWHGAGWGFLVWGALHGAMLMINHGWRALRRHIALPVSQAERWAFWPLTFVAVTIGWVFFRATSLGGALSMLSAMAGLTDVPSSDVLDGLPSAWHTLTDRSPFHMLLAIIDLADIRLPAHAVLGTLHGLLWLPPLLLLSALGPTSQRIAVSTLMLARRGGAARGLAAVAAALCAMLFLLGLYRLNHVTEFLYFQF
jgi:alginate O-acetyltransferase complex protein AlgI